MRRLARIAVMGMAAISLWACDTVNEQLDSSFDRAKAAEPGGSDYDRALYVGYLDMAQQERDKGNISASRHFSDKALAAASGQRVMPDKLYQHWLEIESDAELAEARSDLVALYYTGVTAKLPGEAARAQVAFDCWIQELTDGPSAEETSACRDDFYLAMDATTEKSFTVLFPFDSTSVTDEGASAIKRAASAMRAGQAEKLLVSGHADAVGSSDYNLSLSERRAAEVKRLLMSAGVPEDKIEVIAHGDAEPKIERAAGTREAVNRRVEIELER